MSRGEGTWTRRRLIAACGLSLSGGIAGCNDTGGSSQSDGGSGPSGAGGSDGTDGGSGGSGGGADAGTVSGDPSVSGTWTHPRKSPTATGYATASGPSAPVGEYWSVDSFDTKNRKIALRDETLYSYVDGVFQALAADDGSEVWRESFNKYDPNRVTLGEYVYLSGNPVKALDPSSQTVEWRFDREGNGIVVRDGRLLAAKQASSFSDESSGLTCLDASSGDERWYEEPVGYPRSVVLGPSGRGYFLEDQETVRAITPDGELGWSHGMNVKYHTHGIALGEDRLYATNPQKRLLAFDPATGRVEWRSDLSADYVPAWDGEFVYAVDGIGAVRKVDATSGDPVSGWSVDVGVDWTSPVVTEDTLYMVGTETGDDAPYTLYAFEKDSGSERWRYDMGTDRVASQLVVAEEVLFYVTTEQVVALAPRA